MGGVQLGAPPPPGASLPPKPEQPASSPTLPRLRAAILNYTYTLGANQLPIQSAVVGAASSTQPRLLPKPTQPCPLLHEPQHLSTLTSNIHRLQVGAKAGEIGEHDHGFWMPTFNLHLNAVDFATAERECNMDGGHLAYYSSREEQMEVGPGCCSTLQRLPVHPMRPHAAAEALLASDLQSASSSSKQSLPTLAPTP